MKIMIVEDDVIARMALSSRLRSFGYDLMVFTDGEQAWDAVQLHTTPMLAIIDWTLPGMSGLELVRRISDRDLAGMTYSIVLTSRTDLDDIVATIHAGANDYLSKPFEPDELQRRVRIAEDVISIRNDIMTNWAGLSIKIKELMKLRRIPFNCDRCRSPIDMQEMLDGIQENLLAFVRAQYDGGTCRDCDNQRNASPN